MPVLVGFSKYRYNLECGTWFDVFLHKDRERCLDTITFSKRLSHTAKPPAFLNNLISTVIEVKPCSENPSKSTALRRQKDIYSRSQTRSSVYPI